MKKFEALFGGKKEKKNPEAPEPESNKEGTGELSGIERATKIREEIAGIAGGRNFESLNVEDLRRVLDKHREMEGVLGIASERGIEGSVQEQMDMAREILGEKDFFGPEDIEKIWGVRLAPEDIPPLPFAREDLEYARDHGQFLTLRISETDDGKPLTILAMDDMQKEVYGEAGGGKLFYSRNDEWKKKSDFYTEESPRRAWALVSKDILPESANKNYLQQTDELVRSIEDAYQGRTMPEKYQDAVAKYRSEREPLEKLMESDWKRAAESLEGLKLTEFARHTPVEVVFDGISRFLKTGEKFLENTYTWTSRRDADGRLVDVGGFDSGGAIVGWWDPDDSDDRLGVSLSRSS